MILARAEKLRAEIVEKIQYGVFRYVDYFPNSSRALAELNIRDFTYYAQEWLDAPYNDWSIRTRDKYVGILNLRWIPYLHHRQITHIDSGHVLTALTDATKAFRERYKRAPSISSYNDWLTCIRGPFKHAVKLGHLEKVYDPTKDLENKTRYKRLPDPFEIEEAEKIIACAYKYYGIRWGAWFEFGFFTGIRYPGEAIALEWPDYYPKTEIVKISRIMNNHGVQLTTKTRYERAVDLNDRAINALANLKKHNGVDRGHIFLDDELKPINYMGKIPRRIWKAILKILNIRPRKMYNMRHTYATFGLMNGLNPAYMAEQLGHSLQEFFETYAKWIRQRENATQRSLMSQAIKDIDNESGAKVGQRWGN